MSDDAGKFDMCVANETREQCERLEAGFFKPDADAVRDEARLSDAHQRGP